MGNTRARTLPQRKTAYGGGSEAYHFRMDPETRRQLKEAGAWYEGKNLSYSESCIVRVALRDLLAHLRSSSPADEEEIIGRIEEARAGR